MTLRENEHKEWGTMVFDWGKTKSKISDSSKFRMDKYHIDGLGPMLWLHALSDDGRRTAVEANVKGGRENMEAFSF